MKDSIKLEIGGVRFSISSTVPVILRELEPAYGSFIKQEEKAGRDAEIIDVKVRLELLRPLDTGRLTKVFDSGRTWSMYKEGDNNWLVRQPPAFKEPIWAARFTREIKNITVYCGEDYTRMVDGDKKIATPLRYPLDQILTMYILARHRGLIVHAAGIEFAGKALIFPGPSGAGKSTLTRLFFNESLQNSQRQPGLLSDDRIIVREIDGRIRAFGTPWSGEAGIAQNKSAPLAGIFFLCQNKTNRVKKITPRQALENILKVISVPWYDRDIMPDMLNLCEDLILRVPLFELHFTPTQDVVKLLQEFNPAKNNYFL